MSVQYIGLKFAHILVAIIALGTSAGLGVVLEFYGDHPVHGGFVLGAIRRLMYFVVVPGYVLMLLTGMWMGRLAGLLDAHWTEAAMQLWGIGALFVASSLFVLHRQIKLFAAGPDSRAYRRMAFLGRLFGAAGGGIVVTIVYFMVFKPAG
jgi:uncharacterized membrane protein